MKFRLILALLAVCLPTAVYTQPPVQKLDSAIVRAKRRIMEGNRVIFTPKQAAATISAVGEPDILRHITVLPGVAQGLEGTLGLFVRGSDNTANLIEFNGVPMNSSAHLLGLFSSFPTEMVQETEFSTGGIDVRQGDMASSVVRITPKRALDQQQGGHVSVSPYLVGVSWQRHVSEKTGYSVAIRQSLLPQVGQFLLSAHTETEGTGLSGYLGDGLILTDWKPSDRDRADLMAYWSVDTYQISPESASVRFTTDMLALKAGWQRKLSSNRTWYAKAYLSRAHSGHRQKNKGHTLELTNTRTDASLEGLVEWRSSSGDTYTLGGNYTASFFHPADRGTEPCHLVSAFADWKRRTDTWNWMFGIRSSLALTGNGISPGIDLRAKVDYRLNVHWTLEATFDRLTQYHHTLEGLPTGWNVNIMIPASSDFPAEVTNQGYCGISYRGNLGPFQFQALSGAFLRGMSGLVCYQTTSNLLFVKNASWEESTETGTGRSYGLESYLSVMARRLEASVSYTLSKSDREFPTVNHGKTFPFLYDRRHILNTQFQLLVREKQSKRGHKRQQHFTSAFTWYSGTAVTLPVSQYQGADLPYWSGRQSGWHLSHQAIVLSYSRIEMSEKNSFRLPDYLRWDIAWNWTFHRPKTVHELSLSVYNVTNRHNVFAIYNDNGRWRQVSLLPILPAFRWSMSF